MSNNFSYLAFLTFLAASVTPLASAETVVLHGATTVLNVVVGPHRAAVEKDTGHTLTVVGNATGKGLADLVDGKADASMSSEPVEIAVAAALVAGKTVDPKTLQFHVIKNDEIVFVVHPSNPVSKLTWAQLSDIHTGKISNWKEVGGKDAPIVVFADALTGGTRAMIKKVVMDGKEYGSSVKAMISVVRVAESVAKEENSIGGVGKGFADPVKTKILQSNKIERPLGFITIGAPSAKVKQVIDAFKRAG